MTMKIAGLVVLILYMAVIILAPAAAKPPSNRTR